jgi:hypothetical protein
VTLRGRTFQNPTRLSRNVLLFIVPQFIGMLKFTVILVRTSTSAVPLIGLVDTTTGRGFFDTSAADDPAANRIIASAMIETRLTIFLRTIVPIDLPIAN